MRRGLILEYPSTFSVRRHGGRRYLCLFFRSDGRDVMYVKYYYLVAGTTPGHGVKPRAERVINHIANPINLEQ